MGKETEGWDGLNAGLNYTRDLRHVLANARIGWALEKQAAIAAAVAEEREACAAICDEHCQRLKPLFISCASARAVEALDIATAIRARASGGKLIDRLEVVPTILAMADIAERQCEFEVAEWLRDYFWHSPQGERIRASGGNEEE